MGFLVHMCFIILNVFCYLKKYSILHNFDVKHKKLKFTGISNGDLQNWGGGRRSCFEIFLKTKIFTEL